MIFFKYLLAINLDKKVKPYLNIVNSEVKPEPNSWVTRIWSYKKVIFIFSYEINSSKISCKKFCWKAHDYAQK